MKYHRRLIFSSIAAVALSSEFYIPWEEQQHGMACQDEGPCWGGAQVQDIKAVSFADDSGIPQHFILK